MIFVLLISLGFIAQAHSQAALNVKYADQNRRQDNTTTLRIDQGKVWMNGKQILEENLPASLKHLDPNIYYESTVAGVTEFTFNLGDHYFLIQNGVLTEIQMDDVEPAISGYDSKTETESYYSQLKRESPGLFYGLSREGVLLEQVRSLLLEYGQTKGKDRDKIKEQMRLVLGQLYDINERNKELEIEELEAMIEAAKKEVQYRKANKSKIIDRSLDNLLK